MHRQTTTYSETRSEGSVGFHSATRKPVKGVDYTKYKTRMCRNYMMGAHCPFGDRCAFSHGEPETPTSHCDEADAPPPPPAYTEAVHTDVVLPPAYPSRFRHDPYSFTGVMFEE